MENRVAVVTGGAQGIGKATVRAFLEKRWSVAFIDQDGEAGRETAREYAPLGSNRFIEADVSDYEQVSRSVREIIDTFGRIDVLVNNAGIFNPIPLEHRCPGEWLHVIGVNLNSAYFFASECADALRQSRGSIINIASTRALMSEPNTEAYSASKGGLVALTHALAISLGPEVRVNCISPGWIDVSGWKKTRVRAPTALRDIDHRQHPVGRVGIPEDVAQTALFLASPEAGFITGQNIVVDGGMTRKMIYAE